MNKFKRDFTRGFLFTAAFLFIFIWLFQCSPPEKITVFEEMMYDDRYVFFEIEGMPCVRFKQGHLSGVSCDWTQWEGGE